VVAVLDALSNREKALAIWGVVFVVWVSFKSDGLGRQLLVTLRSALAPNLMLVWIATLSYCVGLVFLSHRLGLWHLTALKETIYWFFGSALVLVGSAITARAFDRAFVRRLVRTAIRLTLIVEFLVGLYVMPLALELLFVPLVALFVGMQAVAALDPKAAQARPFIDGVLGFGGLCLAIYVAVSALTDLDGLLTREHGETFLLVPTFTLALAPLLYAMVKWSRWDQERLRRRWREQEAVL
jgi:hypothetical protein